MLSQSSELFIPEVSFHPIKQMEAGCVLHTRAAAPHEVNVPLRSASEVSVPLGLGCHHDSKSR